MRNSHSYRLLLVGAVLVSGLAHAAPAPRYEVLKRIPVAGDEGWDYLTIDSANHHLYISRGGRVAVMNTLTGKVVAEIGKQQGVHGVALNAKLGRGYISNGRGNSVTVFNLKSFAVTQSISTGMNPDAIIFEPKTGCILTFNGGSNDVTVIDSKTNTAISTIRVSGRPEFAAADGNGHVFVNIEDKSMVEELDIVNRKSLGAVSIAPGEEPSGLAYGKHTVFSVCGNKLMSILDTKSKKLVGTAVIGDGPDAACYDSKMDVAFASNGQDGTLSVVGKVNGKYKSVQTLTTQKSARTMILDPVTHLIYLIAADYVPAAPGQRWGRPKPGSAVILVVGPK